MKQQIKIPINNSENIEELFGFNINKRLRALLEDYEIVATMMQMALVERRPHNNHLIDNLRAAVVASSLRLQSIDYAKRKYCEEKNNNSYTRESIDLLYVNSYKAAKDHMQTVMSRFIKSDKVPSPGVFGAALVLERLSSSFFSAHILYRLGNEYEGHAISRLILEQIAWAYVAYPMQDFERIKKIKTTKTISQMKDMLPKCGLLYGFLSDKTHLDFSNHSEFLKIENGRNVILQSKNNFHDYVYIILTLADLFGIVWELSQVDYLSDVESIELKKGGCVIKQDRPFIKIMEHHLHNIENYSEQAEL